MPDTTLKSYEINVTLTRRQAAALAHTVEFDLGYACNGLAKQGLSKRDLRLALDKVQAARGYHRSK